LFDTINIIFCYIYYYFFLSDILQYITFKPLFQYFQAKFIITKLLNFRKSYGNKNIYIDYEQTYIF